MTLQSAFHSDMNMKSVCLIFKGLFEEFQKFMRNNGKINKSNNNLKFQVKNEPK